MSIRVHELAKKIGRDNKETLEILKKYSVEAKSVSASVDNITAAAIVEEYNANAEEAPDKTVAVVSAEPVAAAPAKPTLPPGVFVKSAAMVEKEQKDREAAKRAPVAPPPPPAASQAAPRTSAPVPPAQPRRAAPVPPQASKMAPPPKAAPAPTRAPAPAINPGVRPAPAPAANPGVRPAPAANTASRPTPAPVVKAPAVHAAKPNTPALAPKPAAPAPKPAAAPAPVAPAPVAASPKAPLVTPPLNAGAAPRPATAPTPTPHPTEVKQGPVSESAEDRGEKRKLQIKPPIVVKDFAARLGMKPFRLISELMEMGIFSSMNQTIDEEIASKIADVHGFELDVRHRGEGTVTKESQSLLKKPQKAKDAPESLEDRSPVVCIMGHVDHGKTTLLDSIRKADVVSGEHGGITQHVAAYQIEHAGKKITFLDTPGHAAFSGIRERGANVTDIVIIVVAADDGFMPQTDEALKFAKRSQAAIMVAINKIDAKGANIERVKQQMQERGIAPEDWGGETICVGVSALKGENIDQLIEMILLQSEVEELQANPKANAEGVIIESQMEQGRGPTATVIVDRGTLKPGDSLVCGTAYCKARALLDEFGKNLKSAPPSTPVKIIGWSETPRCGERFEKTKNDREAKRLAEENLLAQKKEEADLLAEATAASRKSGETGLEALFAAINETQRRVLPVIVKADVGGSVEAIRTSLAQIKSDKVSLKIISAEIGPVTKNDVTRASTAGATLLAFNVTPENGVRSQAKHEGVEIYHSSIIYELIDTATDLLADLLEPEIKEVHVGTAEVRATFSVGRGVVAGCMVLDGKILRDKQARLLRDGEVVYERKIDTLRRFKEDVGEVRTGFECGIRMFDFDGYQEGDKIECYDIEKIKPAL